MSCDAAGHCITCSDEGIEMRVLRIDATRAMALCESPDGAHSSVEIALVETAPGDWLLVHAGTAIQKLRPDAERSSQDVGLDARRGCVS